MTRDPKRWLDADSDASAPIREFLGSYDCDPTDARVARLSARLSGILGPAVLGGAVGGAGLGGPAASSVDLAAASQPPPPWVGAPPAGGPVGLPIGSTDMGMGLGKVAAAGTWSTAKLALVGAVAGVSLVTAVAVVRTGGGGDAAKASRQPVALAPQGPDVLPVPTPEGPALELPSAPSQDLTTGVEKTAGEGRRDHSPLRKASLGAGEKREAELLGAAQRALAEGKPEQALEITRQHRVLPRPMLVQERERIAIEALVRLGRASAAAERAARFRRSFPKSGYLPRIDSLFPSREKSTGE